MVNKFVCIVYIIINFRLISKNYYTESVNPPNNETSSLSRSIAVGNAALEIARVLSDPQNKNDQLHEEEILDEDEDDVIQQLPSVGEFPDIQYIIQNSSIPVSFQLIFSSISTAFYR